MKHFSVLLFSCLCFTISLAQHTLQGRFLVSVSDYNPDTYLPFEFRPNGGILQFESHPKDSFVIGKWEQFKDFISLNFEDRQYANFDGLYEISTMGDGLFNYKLQSQNTTLYVRNYNENSIEKRNKRLNIEGHWIAKLQNDVEVEYHFILPNIIKIATQEEGRIIAEDKMFWEVNDSLNTIIMYPERMCPNSGKLTNVEVKNGMLYCNLGDDKMVFSKKDTDTQLHKDSHLSLTQYPVGKYIMNFGDYAKNEDNTFVVNIDNKGQILYIFPEESHKDVLFAKMILTDGDPKIEFVDILKEYSGNYDYNYQTHLCFEFTNGSKHLSFSPFEPDYSEERELAFGGKWKWEEGDNKLLLHFRAKNIVEIEVQKKYESTSTMLFWQSHINGEDISLIPILFFNEFTGDYKQFHVKDNMLHFDYDGKHYTMQRIE